MSEACLLHCRQAVRKEQQNNGLRAEGSRQHPKAGRQGIWEKTDSNWQQQRV